MKIAFGCDHAVGEKRNLIITFIKQQGHEVIDCGTAGTESVDYPRFGYKAAVLVATKQVDRAIIVCGTGIGIGISANKVKNIRCVLGHNPTLAEVGRKKYDANVLSLGMRISNEKNMQDIIVSFLETKFKKIYFLNVKCMNKVGKENFNISL